MRVATDLDTVPDMFMCTAQSWFFKPRSAA